MINFTFNKNLEFLNKVEAVLKIPYRINDYSVIEDQYEIFNNCFGDDSYKDSNLNREVIEPITSDEKFLHSFRDDVNYVVGIDLPTFITTPNAKGTIIVLGEDPLRENAMKNNEPQPIILSTPFGVHLSICRKGKQKIYWEISERILTAGYNIYFTDINKIWMKGKGNPSKSKIPNDLKEKYLECLNKEIELFNPLLLITFGNKAKIASQQTKIDLEKKLSLPHPAARKNTWEKLINKSATNQNIVDYLIELLDNKIS